MKVGELFVALGFDVDEDKLKGFNDRITTARNNVIKLAAVAAAGVFAVNRFVAGSVDAALSMRNFNTETGNSIETLQKWQRVAVMKNPAMSADQVTESFKAMAQAIADVEMGKGNPAAFSMLGITDVRGRDVGDVLEELRVKIDRNLDEWTRNGKVAAVFGRGGLLSQIGFDPSMIQALRLSKKEFDSLSKNKFLKQEQIDRLVKLSESFARIRVEWNLFKDTVSAEIAPYLIEYLDKVIPMVVGFKNELVATWKALSNLWDNLEPRDKTALKALAIGLVVWFNPVKTLFVGLAWALYEVGKAWRDLENSNLYKAAQTIRAAPQNLVNKLSAIQMAQVDFMSGLFGGGAESDFARMQKNSNINFTNVWNIQSSQDLNGLSDVLIEQQSRMLKAAAADQGNGGRF